MNAPPVPLIRRTAVIGSASSLEDALAKVPSQSDLPTFVWWIADRDLRSGKPPEGKLDGGEGNEGG